MSINRTTVYVSLKLSILQPWTAVSVLCDHTVNYFIVSAYLWCFRGSLLNICLWTPLLTMLQSTASLVSSLMYTWLPKGIHLTMAAIYPADQLVQSNPPPFIFIFYFPLLKLRISQLSQPSLIAECGHQLVHKIAWYLSQSVGFKNKQQFLTTKAVIKQASFHKSWTRKMHQKCCLFVLHSQSYLNNALLKINHGHVVLCFSRRQTGSGREDRESKKWLSIITYTENTNWQLVVSNRQNNYSKHMSINASLKMSPTTQTPCCHRRFFSRCKLAFFSLLLALILMHIASRGNMDHACNLRGFLTNHMFKRATGSFQCLCLAVVCGYVCVCHECNSLYTS